MPAHSQTITPAFLYENNRLVAGRQLSIEDDLISHIDEASGSAWNVALLPGFINAHSHAFQRGLRGRAESFGTGTGNFFTWRDEMYALVDRLDGDLAYTLTLQAFEEMLDAGYTTVGEFHYIHHAQDKRWALDTAIIQAARDSGIRLTLLQTDYVTGGFSAPLTGGQIRFDSGAEQEFLDQLDLLGSELTGARESLGMVCHSVRAVPLTRFQTMREEARSRDMVFHLHLEEVVQEIEDCRDAHGKGPMRALLDMGIIDERTTAVHCTHSTREDLLDFGAAGGIVCLCPLTEGNLGDGIPDVPAMRETKCRIAIGGDLNARICPTEELRMLEYEQRMKLQSRGIVQNADGLSGPALLACGTSHGAESLGVNSGALEKGRLADMVAIDLEHPSVIGIKPEHLLSAILMGTGPEAVVGTCVGGNWLRGGPPPESQ